MRNTTPPPAERTPHYPFEPQGAVLPFGDMNGPIHYWGPADADPDTANPSRATQWAPAMATSIQPWLAFLRTMESLYARLAAERGEPFMPLSDDERLTAARLAAALCEANTAPTRSVA